MKNLKSIITVFIALTSTVFYGQTTANNGIIETALKGKSDLLKIISESREFNFGLSASDLEKAQTASPIEEFTANFDSFLNDNVTNINNISRSDERFIVPLVTDSKVVTTVTVASNSKRTKIAELVNKQYSSELNLLPAEIKRINFKGLKVIHVPNIDAILYIHEDKCYTSYNGRSVREGLSISQISSQLQVDAREFNAEFGEQLKKGKLVK